MITAETIRGWHWRTVFHADAADRAIWFRVAVENDRVAMTDTFHRRERRSARIFTVGGAECRTLDEVAAALNASEAGAP